MKQRRFIIVFALLCAFLLTPEMMCLIPGVQMTMDEHECCRHMKADCGKVPMPMHSCCSKVETRGPAIATAGKIIVQLPVEAVAVLTDPLSNRSDFFQTLPWRVDTSPPLVAVFQSLNILRI